jgi:hypothetical protein
VLGVWKGVPYVERLCWGCDLGKVEDEEHLLLICPNTQKVRERFCSTLPLTHTSTLAKLMQTMNTAALAKFVACYQYQRTICPPSSTFCLMDSLVPNGHTIVNSKQKQGVFLLKICLVGALEILQKRNESSLATWQSRNFMKPPYTYYGDILGAIV